MIENARAIGPIGTASRVLVGFGLLYFALSSESRGLAWGIEWWQVLLGLVGLPGLLLLGQAVRLRYTKAPLRETSHLGFCLNFAIAGALIIASPTRASAFLFLGASLLVAARRGYAGCESLAISNWLLRRDDAVGCVLFSPIDEAETCLRGKGAAA